MKYIQLSFITICVWRKDHVYIISTLDKFKLSPSIRKPLEGCMKNKFKDPSPYTIFWCPGIFCAITELWKNVNFAISEVLWYFTPLYFMILFVNTWLTIPNCMIFFEKNVFWWMSCLLILSITYFIVQSDNSSMNPWLIGDRIWQKAYYKINLVRYPVKDVKPFPTARLVTFDQTTINDSNDVAPEDTVSYLL